jgi:hypothetical protein
MSEESLEEMACYQMPKNSAVSSMLAMNNLKDWLEDYNKRHPHSLCPLDILSPRCTSELLNKWLAVFVTETRNQKGEPYPPKTIYSILCGILREMRVRIPKLHELARSCFYQIYKDVG